MSAPRHVLPRTIRSRAGCDARTEKAACACAVPLSSSLSVCMVVGMTYELRRCTAMQHKKTRCVYMLCSACIEDHIDRVVVGGCLAYIRDVNAPIMVYIITGTVWARMQPPGVQYYEYFRLPIYRILLTLGLSLSQSHTCNTPCQLLPLRGESHRLCYLPQQLWFSYSVNRILPNPHNCSVSMADSSITTKEYNTNF